MANPFDLAEAELTARAPFGAKQEPIFGAIAARRKAEAEANPWDTAEAKLSAQPPPPEASTGKLGGAYYALKRGVMTAVALPDVISATGTAGLGKPTMGQERRAFEASMTDPRYQAEAMSAKTPERAARVENTLGQKAKLGQIMAPGLTLQSADSDAVTQARQEIAAVPKSPAQIRIAQARTSAEKWNVWLQDPVELTASIAFESLPPSIAGSTIGSVFGPAGMVAGVGAASALTTFGSEFLNNASEMGVDITDPISFQKFLNDEPSFRAAFEPAMVKSGIVGGVDALTAGQAGRWIEPALKQGFRQKLLASAQELGLQMGGGAGGEFAGQVATGQQLDPFDIAMEAMAEVATAPGEIIGNLRNKAHADQKQASSRIPPSDSSAGFNPSGEAGATPAPPDNQSGKPGLVTGALESARQASTPDNTPATKADLKALADFIQNGGNNPFAPKSASAPADVTEKPTQTITGSNVQPGTEMPVQPQAGAATLKPEGTVIKARDGSNARYIKRNGQWYRRPNAGSSEVLVEDGDVISILEQDTTTLPHADAGQTARAPGSRPLATATQPFAAKPHRYFIRMAGSQKAFEVQSLTDARAKLQAMKDSGVNLNGDILDETGKLIGEITNGRQRIFPDESQSQAGAATTLPPAAAGQTATATPVTQTALPAGGTLPAQPPAQGGENTNGQKEKGRGQTLLKQPENKIVAPAAVLTTPPATPAKPARGRKGFRIQPRSDGIVDVLDAIQEEGGLRSPTAADVADGDYDGFKEAMIGPAALLRRRTEGYHPTEIIKFIQAEFPRIKTSGDLYQAIRDAVAQRDNLRRNGGGAEAQQQRFWDAATGPKSTSGLVKINTNQLAVGHVFRLRAPGVSHEELTVTHVDADTGEVQVKDGTSFGVQDLPDGAEIWVQKKGLAPELQAAQVKPTDAPPVANATPGNQPAAQPGGKPKAGGAVPASASDPGAVRAGERLERAIRGVAGNENVTIKLSGPPTGNGLGNGAGRSLASGLQSIADVFGKRIVWFTASDLESGRNLRGYADPGGKYILVNSDYPLTALGTAIHELLHQFQNSNPVLYADFKRDMLAMAKLTGSTYQDVKWSANAYGHDLSDELMCDFAAHAFNDPKFVRDFAARDPGLFRRVVNRLVKLLDRILFQLTRTQKTASEVFPDLQAARDRLAKALVEWADYEQNVKKVRAEIDKANGENKPAKLKTALKASNATLTKPGLVNINPPEPPPQFSITAHHGTPHKVDKFTTEKIGTGEGQQVYGWGLYFAENEKVAADYANRLGGQPKPQRLLLDGQEYGQLSGSLNSDEESAFYELDQRQHWWNPDKVDPLAKVEQELTKTVENYQRVRAAIKSGRGIAEQGYTERDMQAFLQAEHTLNWLNKNRDRMQVARQTKGGGNQYTIELNADPEEFLDWDKPFNEQSEFVQSALVRTGLAPELAKFNSGQAIYAQIPRGTSGHPKVASGKLEEVGIRGIRYLDQGSRNPPGRPPAPSDYDIQRAKDEIASWKVAKTGFRSEADRQQTIASWTAKLAMLEDRKQRSESWKPPVGTYNYVVFNEGDIQITHENGQPVTTAQAFSTDFDNDLFSAPESVADQKARLDREKRATDERKAKENMQARAAARLTGKDLDTTKEMFGAEVKQDKEGQGSFFDRKTEYRVDNRHLNAVASAYGVAPETAAKILNDHKPYQQDFGLDDPLFAPPKGKATNPAGIDGGKPAQGISAGTNGGLEPQAGSLATHKAADFQRDFARNPLISSIKPDKTATHAVPVYNVNGQTINSPSDFARTMLSIRSPYNESLKIAILDANNVVQHSETLYAGALDGLYADARDFLRLFEKHAGAGRRMYFAHNHPSGVVTPSAADVSVTAKVRRAATAAGFEIVDHVITNGHAYYSFNSQSVETLNNTKLADWEVIPRADLQHTTVSTDSDLKRLVEALRQGNQDFAHIIYLNTRNHITAIERTSSGPADFARRVIRGIAREGAMNVLIDFGPKVNPSVAADRVRTINANSGGTSQVIDFSAQEVMSGRLTGYMSDAPMGALETDMDEPGPIWRSNMADSLATWQPKGTPQQLLAHLAKTRGAMDEAEWIGLDDFLKDKPSVTKAAVAEFVKASTVDVREVTKGDTATPEGRNKALNARSQSEYGKDYSDLTDAQADRVDELMDADQSYKSDGTKFANYQLPGGENYRELLLTLPVPVDIKKVSPDFIREYKAMHPSASDHEVAAAYDRYELKKPNQSYFKSSHFDEPNILAHVRFNERTDADGKRVLFIEEVQSDWHQNGRKHGYNTQPDTTGWKAIFRGRNEASDNDLMATYEVWRADGTRAGLYDGTSPDAAIAGAAANGYASVPNAPFKQTWPMLAMKRMIRYAAEHGFDRIGWTTGDQQAERYDLSKQVDSIRLTKKASGSYTIEVTRNGRSEAELIKDGVKPNDLGDYIGKELASKALAAPEQEEQVFAGDNLRVGGKGMRKFYDEMLPSEVNKFVKKWGGRVGQGDIKQTARVLNYPNGVFQIQGSQTEYRIKEYGDEWRVQWRPSPSDTWIQNTTSFKTQGDAANSVIKGVEVPVHTLDITPAMRESALQGMPMFSTDFDPPDVATLDKLKSDITAAEQALKTAVRAAVDPNRAIPRADADQAAALATANLRALQDEYDKHPDRLRAMPLSELEAHAQATAARLAEIAETPVATGNQLPDDLRGERWRLMREAKRIAAERWNRPEIVADALRKAEKLTDALRAASKAQDATAMRHAIEELQALQDAEFAQIKPDLLAAVRADLEAKGEIKPLAADKRGRTLADLTDWMKARKLDSPKLTLKERVNLAKRLADEFNAGKDKLTHALVRSRAMWQAFKAQWKAPIKDDSVRSIFKEWHYEKQFSGIETHQFASKLRADIPKKVRRMAISVWLDANGDRGLLTAQKMDVPARFLPVWTAALNLTADEKALAMRLKQDFAQKLADGQLLGLIEKGRDSYGVPQIWEVFPQHGEDYAGGDGKSKRPRNPGAKLDPRDPFFALKRTHDTYFDGIMAGGIPRSLDIADLVGVYNVEFHGALADRSVIKALKDAKMPDNTAAVKVSGGAKIEVLPTGARVQFVDSNWKPADAVAADGRPYRAVDHWALRGWKFAATDAAGNPIMVQGDFLVHPDLYANIKTQLEGKSALRDPEGPLGAIAHITGGLLKSGAFLKASKFASATFHGATLAEHMMTHAFSGKPSRERLGLLNPYVGGVEINPSRDREVANLIRHGMDMGFGGYRAMFEEGLTSHGGIWAHVPGLGDGMAWLSDGMFKEYLPRLKVKLGKAVLHANRARYSSKLTEQQIYELTASQVNAAFGGQNWALLGRSKTFLDVNRLFLTAPDFLLSRAKVVGQAFKPYNREQSLFILAQAALVYALARILNLLLDDDPHWEPENALQVIHNGKAWSARFIVNDMLHAATDPAGFASGRLGPWPRTGFEMITGRDMRTGARKDVPIDTENPAFRAAQIAAVDLAQWLIPVGADGLLPGATGREQTGPGQFALGLVGVGSRRYTAETEMFQLAAKFNRGSEDPRANRQQKMRDDAPKQQSAYRKLDVLLEVDDLPAARKEYLALQKDGHTKDAIAARMKAITDGHLAHPFTGSQEREKQFKASLTPAQRMEYERAVALRKERAQKFSRMLNQQN